MKRAPRLPRWRRRRDSAAESNDSKVERRTLLVGGAAAAGIAAAAATSPVGTAAGLVSSSREAAPSLALQTVEPIAASSVTVVPTGEIVGTNVQAVLQELDTRLSKTRAVDNLHSAMTLVDDFMGGAAASGMVGELGWTIPLAHTGTPRLGINSDAPGVYYVDTGAGSWENINLGTANLKGHPVLACELRLRISHKLSDPADPNHYTCWFGLHDDRGGAEPKVGLYYRFKSTLNQWEAIARASSTSSTVSAVSSATAPVNTNWHRFRIDCNGSLVTFTIDGKVVAAISTTLPSNGYTPAFSIRKTPPQGVTAGKESRSIALDYFALRYGFTR